MTRTIQLEFDYAHPPAAVWEAITDPKRLGEWLMPNDFAPVVGHRFRFTMPPKPGFDGIIYCEVKEIDPPRRLVYTWSGKWGSEDTIVTWTLEPTAAGGTRLTLTHAGFRGVKGVLLSLMMRSGWRKLLGKVVATWMSSRSQEARHADARVHG
jgi:uncharacterized protein YndB with AHSA1/START domain